VPLPLSTDHHLSKPKSEMTPFMDAEDSSAIDLSELEAGEGESTRKILTLVSTRQKIGDVTCGTQNEWTVKEGRGWVIVKGRASTITEPDCAKGALPLSRW
jgi:hypothetical protein